jgi:predicted permease
VVAEAIVYRDLIFALRQLRSSPGFLLAAVATLALGTGANIAIFTLVDSILLRPLPFPQQEQLMRIEGSPENADATLFPKGWIRALDQHSAAFASISGFGPDIESNVGDASSTERLFGAQVMANAFNALQLHPAAGRFFARDDAIGGHDPVVVLSYGFWMERFGGSRAAIGQTIRIDGVSRHILGVMPAGMHFPYADTQFLTPVTFKANDAIDAWADFNLRAFGRLRPGMTAAQAQAELRRQHGLLLPLFPWVMPDGWAAHTTVVPLLESEVGPMRPRLLLLFAAVGLILLIACANVANLMLARAAGREREMAIRGALGASRARLLRQLLAESVVLALLAGVAGIIAAAFSLRAFTGLLPANTPRLAEVSLGWHVLAFAAAASIFAGLLFGLIPALRMAAPQSGDSLHSGSRSVAGKPGQFRESLALVVGQIALSVLVVTAAGLMLHSLWNLMQVNPGFRATRVVTAEVSLDADTCPSIISGGSLGTPGHCWAFFNTLLDRLRGLPGLENVALTGSLPLNGNEGNFVFDAEGHPRAARQIAFVGTARAVSPGYFAALGLNLLRGRLLGAQDASGASHAVVIDEKMAQELWPNQDPLGKHIINVAAEKTPGVWNAQYSLEVVGVVSNTHEGSVASSYGMEIYEPMIPLLEMPSMYVLLRTPASAEQAADELRQAVAAIDPLVPVTRVRTLEQVVGATQSAARSLTLLLLAFGGLAVIIGAVGVYSLIAYVVSWRTREIGIRLALGAQRWQIIGAVVRQGLLLALSGSAVGFLASALAARLLRGFLFNVQALDPITLCAVTLLMTLLALAAAWVPAQRAANVDPIKTLRLE